MKGTFIKILTLSLFFIPIIFYSSCKKESSKEATVEIPPLVGAEIDAQNIETLTGVPFKILKTETIGYKPLHKFYWISIQEKVSSQKVEELAHTIIKETIARKPKTFHSFTIHLFWEDQLADTVEKSEPFARATFLPEGGWLKVGRDPIDDYGNYKLSCNFIE